MLSSVEAEEVALAAAHGVVSSAGWAATRLLGLDPFEVARVLADLAGDVDGTAASGVADAGPLLAATRPAPEEVAAPVRG